MIRPFRALRYESSRTGPLQNVITQPYDKITPAMKEAYALRSPYSAVHLIRGEKDASDVTWYGGVRPRLESWLAEGAVIAERDPAYFVYRQRFTSPDGKVRIRTGITGAFDLDRRSAVLHHERTHAGPRKDRRMLLDACGVHFGQVFLVRTSGPDIEPAWLDDGHVIGEFEDGEGVLHSFSRVSGTDQVAAIAGAFAESRYVIADGHHRFTVACGYADDVKTTPARHVQVTCVDVRDPGLCVLATHRILRGLPPERTRGLEPFFQRLGARPVPFLGSHAPLTEEVKRAGRGTIGVAFQRSGFLWSTGPEGPIDEVASLDVARLHASIIDPLLTGLEVEHHLDYARGADTAVEELGRGADVVFLVNPIDAGTVAAVASKGGVMPQKSTDFFPKMLTGFSFLDTRRADVVDRPA